MDRKNFKNALADKVLHDFAEKYKHLPEQGSAQWLEKRKSSFGGSEIAALIGVNPYQKPKKLLATKIGLCSFNGNVATGWGTLMEPVTRNFVEKLFSTEIKELSSLPGALPGQSYSPDGLSVVKLLCSENSDFLKRLIILFEFKCPLSAIPDGKIPKHYLPQLMMGLCSIKIAHSGIFVNNMLRRCSWESLNDDNKYDTIFHKSDIKKNVKVEKPLAAGVMLFYSDDLDALFQKLGISVGINDTDDEYPNGPPNHLNGPPNRAGPIGSHLGTVKLTNNLTTGSHLGDGDSDSDRDSDSDSDSDQPERPVKSLLTRSKNSDMFNKDVFNEDLVTVLDGAFLDFGKRSFENVISLMKAGVSIDYSNFIVITQRVMKQSSFTKIQMQGRSRPDDIDFAGLKENFAKTRESLPNPIGSMSWKLFKSDIIHQERDDSYLDVVAPHIEQYLPLLEKSRNKSAAECIDLLYQNFEDTGSYDDRIIKEAGAAAVSLRKNKSRNMF